MFSRGIIPYKKLSASKLVSEIEKKHPFILDYLYGRSKGIDVSNISAEIADFIVQWFLERKIMCVSVFDCFVVQRECQDDLIKVMKLAYETVLGDSYNCRIKQEF